MCVLAFFPGVSVDQESGNITSQTTIMRQQQLIICCLQEKTRAISPAYGYAFFPLPLKEHLKAFTSSFFCFWQRRTTYDEI
jgi:hypothetical protein